MVSPMPKPPSERASDRSPWVKSSKTRGSSSGAMPMPVSRTRMIACPSFEAGVQLDAAAGLGVLGRVVQQVDDDLLEPGRVGLDHDAFRLDRDMKVVVPLLDQRTDGRRRRSEEGRQVDPAGGGAGSYPA